MVQPRTAIITGGLQGIGLAIATELAALGFNIAVGARRGGDDESVARARRVLGDDCMIAVLDVRCTDSVEAFAERVEKPFGAAGVLVNAAGISVHQMIEGHAEEDWLDVIDTNLNGPFRMTRACLPQMKSP